MSVSSQPALGARYRAAKKKNEFKPEIELNGIDWRIWAVAGSGFFITSYSLFAANILIPSLSFTYWKNDILDGRETRLDAFGALGAIVGQLLFGYLADRYGRRRFYGLELIITIFGLMGLLQSQDYSDVPMSVLGFTMIWRFILGVGIGAEYPLSAVITAEFSSKKSRNKTMAAVFLMQPVGEFIASVLSIAILFAYGGLLVESAENDSVAASLIIRDVWAVVIGIGAIPALLAIGFRMTIPESPRYELDVMALSTVKRTKCDLECDVTRKPGVQFSWHDMKTFFFDDGNWRYLLSAIMVWFLLDFTSYGLGINNPKYAGEVFTANLLINQSQPYNISATLSSQYEALLTESIQRTSTILAHSILGSIILLELIWEATWSSIIASSYFITAVINYVYPGIGRGHFLDTLFQLFFNLGPNTLTFIIVAEVCPTRYRGTCYGISIASGKFCSGILQKIVSNFNIYFETSSGVVLLTFMTLLIGRAFLSFNRWHRWDSSRLVNANSLQFRSLEELAQGRKLQVANIAFQVNTEQTSTQLMHKDAPESGSLSRSRGFLSCMTSLLPMMIKGHRVAKYWASSFFLPRPQKGSTRIQWRCDCGLLLYGDFKISSEEEKRRLVEFLASPSQTQNDPGSSNNSFASGSNTELTQEFDLGNSTGNLNFIKTPTTTSNSTSPEGSILNYRISQFKENNSMNKYLALCVNTGRCHMTLGEINVSSILQDSEVFRMIKQRYLEIRGFRAHARRLFLLKPSSIHFVKVNIEDSHRADIIAKPSIPPPEEVLENRYHYAPLDLPLPPITTNSFIHYMENPECESLAKTNKWLGCLPKRLRDRLGQQRLATDPNLNVTGWGIHVEEGLDWESVAIMTFLILLASGVVGLSYTLAMHDVSGGFAIAAWIVGVLGTLLTSLYLRWQRL